MKRCFNTLALSLLALSLTGISCNNSREEKKSKQPPAKTDVPIRKIPDELYDLSSGHSYEGKKVLVICFAPMWDSQNRDRNNSSYTHQAHLSHFRDADLTYISLHDYLSQPLIAREQEITAAALQIVMDYYKNNGTIDFLVPFGHGENFRIGEENCTEGQLNVFQFLRDLSKKQTNLIAKKQKPIANNIFVTGCSVLRYIPPTRIKELHNISQNAQWNFYGSTSVAFSFLSQGFAGRFMRFSSSGEVNKSRIYYQHPDDGCHQDVHEKICKKPDAPWSKYYFGNTPFEQELAAHQSAFEHQ